MPKPISSTTGASRPNRATRSSGAGAKSIPMTGQSSPGAFSLPFGQASSRRTVKLRILRINLPLICSWRTAGKSLRRRRWRYWSGDLDLQARFLPLRRNTLAGEYPTGYDEALSHQDIKGADVNSGAQPF